MGQLDARRAAERADRDRRAVLAFFTAFASARFEVAQEKTAPGFTWFGKAITAADWAGDKLKQYVADAALAAHDAREVPAEIVDRWVRADAEQLCDGAIDAEDSVVLVDVDRGGSTSTCGVIVTRDARMRRVFDPEALRTALANAGPN
ncbi:MAG: hypothetical protein RIT81_01480 [Deltaproteobacteria bacterium]